MSGRNSSRDVLIAGQLLLNLHSIKDRKLVKSHNTEPLPQNIVSPFFRDTHTQKKTCLLVAAAIDFSICLSEYGGTLKKPATRRLESCVRID